MSVHLTEEEQLEVLKRWWKDYGKTVVFSILFAVGGYFAFTGWQNQQHEKKVNFSMIYDDLLRITSAESSLSDADKATASHLATQLKEGKSSSLYAHNAAFFLAKMAVADNNLAQAADELRWVLANRPDVATEQLARLRLARVLIAQETYDEAEKLLATPADAFKSEYLEARADIYKARGELDAARTAYEQALADTDPQQQERVMLLQLKRDDLKLPSSNDIAQQTSAEIVQ